MQSTMQVYLSHTDAERIREAASASGMSISQFVRLAALRRADQLAIVADLRRNVPGVGEVRIDGELIGQVSLPLLGVE